MTELYHLYALVSEGRHRPFYIGATCDPRLREKAHRKKFGSQFTLNVLETREDAREIARLETELINWYLSQGVPLLNKALKSAYTGRGLNTRLERYISRARSPVYRHGNGARYKPGYPPGFQETAAARVAKRLANHEKKERKLRLEAEATVARAKLAEMVANGSADRLATAFLATQKALLAATDEEAGKIAAAYFAPQKQTCD